MELRKFIGKRGKGKKKWCSGEWQGTRAKRRDKEERGREEGKESLKEGNIAGIGGSRPSLNALRERLYLHNNGGL